MLQTHFTKHINFYPNVCVNRPMTRIMKQQDAQIAHMGKFRQDRNLLFFLINPSDWNFQLSQEIRISLLRLATETAKQFLKKKDKNQGKILSWRNWPIYGERWS